ncbi:SDR family NAD(P)-dependent oxidoreductase [Microvirga tunisiensis]|uniref:SDR family NAD(P)-dependent oxidoreductase n=1 Tax=Pannonibacter tanglangensis TaxID=2750084 RepID=A0A7X5F241_9HYPH|nr:type I polyketide synthase [Pannonibacter sp. XCT-53]NBN78351.1 SDR family NAD(P)-dependent oxidoreductase [Pannonibacter sp. XCT-53]
MASIKSNIEIIGYASRLPGAADTNEFWTVLKEGRCTVTSVSEDRWPLSRFGHPDRSAAGKAYTWAAGQLDDVWGFDPSFFGISPREALQMDPQQRILLQLVWEALEQAGLPPSALAGTSTGVYVGASSLDYHHRFVIDPPNADMQFMTGNTLSIVSNRISYIYDLRGPSFTVDTACSSSLVALHEAVSALESGQIDTAIVCGVSMLLSPFSFVGFSRASMLSPTGLCQAFDANGDGYVRSEGAVVLVLQSSRVARANGTRVHGRILASGINADGRTVGLSLPSPYAQAALLAEMYGAGGVDPNALAFVEAHGTGTRVGDPAEAEALGKVIGQKRDDVLHIGSVKTNVGHLEPVSGLVGLLKSLLALKHNELPRSLHFNTPNPDIAFEELNLKVASEPVALKASDKPRLAGINSFGFGGTNAHVVISDGDRDAAPAAAEAPRLDTPLVLSARGKAALGQLARRYHEALDGASDGKAAQIAASAAYTRDLLGDRLVVLGATADERRRVLETFLADGSCPNLVQGSTVRGEQKVGFVFSGNGSQWAGMGRDAYQKDTAFQQAFERVDRKFMGLGGWSLLTTLFSEDLETEIERTEIAQPLLFAVQVALVEALARRGLRPSAVAGHSVGEVAAAWCSGALTLDQAVKVIHARSTRQEVIRDLGTMAALLLSAEEAQAAINEAGFPRIELAAINSPRSVTISGPVESLDAFGKYARKKRWAMKKLNLAYPFHCALVEPIREPLLAALEGVTPRAATVPFYSTVDPDRRDVALDPDYWWRNVRQPVLFSAAIDAMAADGISVFLEIGPRPVLGTYMTDVLKEAGQRADVLASLDMPAKTGETARNPVEYAAADVLAHGGAVDLGAFFGEAPADPVALPHYPWQNVPFKPEATPESVDYMFGKSWPLLGYRLRQDVGEWFNHVDPQLLPWLADHKVEESVVFPAAGYTEMALRAALRWSGADEIELRDFDILRPLVFDGAETFETQVRISSDDRVVEVLSRPRLAGAEWALNARGHYVSAVRKDRKPVIGTGSQALVTLDHDALYEVTRAFGLRYGPAFQRADSVVTHDRTTATVTLKPQIEALGTQRFALCPTLLDAGFHGLFALLSGVQEIPAQTSFLPIRFGALRLLAPEVVPASVRIKVTKASPRSIEASFEYLDAEGQVVARLTQARFRAVRLGRETRQDDLAYRTFATLLADAGRVAPVADVMPQGFAAFAQAAGVASDSDFEPGETLLLVEAMGRTIAHETLWRIAGGARFDAAALVAAGRIAESALPLVHALLGWLTDSGLAEDQGEVTLLGDPAEGPATADLLKTVALEASGHIAEAALLSRLHDGLEGLLARGLADKASGWFASGLFEAYQTSSPAALARNEGLRHLAERIIAGWPKDQALRLLVLGADSPELLLALDRACDPRRASVTVTDPVSTLLGRAERQWTGSSNVRFVAFEEADALAAAGPFDIILSGGSLTDRNADDIAAVVRHLVRGGLLFSAEFVPSPLTDLLRGIGADWWRETAVAGFPVSRQRGAEEWRGMLEGFGLTDIETVALASDVAEATLIGARAPVAAPAEAEIAADGDPTAELIVIADAEGDSRKLAEALKSTLAPRGIRVTVAAADADGSDQGLIGLTLTPGAAETAALLKRATAGIVHLAGAFAPAGDALAVVDQRTWQLTQLLNSLGFADTRLWIVAPGGMQDIAGGAAHRPDQAAVWAYGRVAMNEFANAGIRLIDLSPTLEPGVAAVRLAEEILKSGEEREIILDGRRRSGLRIVQGGLFADSAVSPDASPAMRLDILRQGSLDQLAWHAVDRKAPAGNEIEIAVEASGLNFRDVMWALGLLPEEALEDGFAGPTLGMECCGIVLATGPDVTRFRPGDKVITFAPACFASHVTVSEDACAPMPSTVSSEEAATIPVTFLTAYYALVHLARLSEGETVLIHGGAGGVGLAALQIAKWRGARVITTAGSEEKRSFLKLLGADLVLDSRSLAFVDEVMTATDGEGVDVVLNSLFGEAMERSIEVLRPFGRFLELGKRDYYGNTRIGLRPFRQNLTYFGIDADQLLTRQPKLAKELFVELVRLFEAGTLAPLPYRVFEADGVVEAFRLMQQAGHIGKIILRPPHVPAEVRRTRTLTLSAEATYVIGGGFGGFGTELLRRLVDLGARHLVVLSRRGGTGEEAARVIGELAARGVTVQAPACDLTDEKGLAAALETARASLPPIRGVFHTAMVLNDVLISNLDHDGLTRVLAPKVRGAELLDRLTANDPLDHFVVYSSATTLVGNPGQANYVAANGYLEALARKRRAEGKPGLAVAWGAISDAGYLARNEDVNELLSRKLGRHALTAREALDGLVTLMSEPQTDLETAAVGYARIDWQAARRDLALLDTPLVALMGLGSVEDGTAAEGAIDLTVLLKGMDKVKAVTTVCGLLAGEIGKILRISPEEIDPHKPLSEVGMDSLMALELRMSAERQLGIDIPLMSLANGATLIDLATRVVNRVLGGEGESGASAEAQQLASQHVSEDLAEAGDLAGIAEQVEAKSREMRSLL